MSSVKTGKKKDIYVIMEVDLNEEKDKIVKSCPFPLSKGKRKREEGGKRESCTGSLDLIFRESVFLLSRFLNDPTVGSIRDKKENCSRRRGLRVGTRFREFPQTPRGRGFSLLGFLRFFLSVFQCFGWLRP